MKITSELLKAKRACKGGTDWFLEHFPEREADYQAVLDALADDNQVGYAQWLFENVGADEEAVVEVAAVADRRNIFVAGRLLCQGAIQISGYLLAGLRVKIDRWSVSARVVAKPKPKNLISGFRVEVTSTTTEKVGA